jgi:hypothetical protein
MTLATMSSPLTADMIAGVIAGLPIQGRIIIRLLLLQHFDVTQEEILYMVADRPDPRCVSGKKPVTTMTQESITAMMNRRDEYRRRARLRRERAGLQCIALTNQARMATALASRSEALLINRGVSASTIAQLTSQARTAVPGPTLRLLEERWGTGEITEEDYQKHRLAIELQTQVRFTDRFKKRLDLVERERQTSDQTTLLDHEIGHIWGLPAGTLAARKVKFLSQYLLAIQARCSGTHPSENVTPSPSLWNETLRVLSQTPIERSVATYDGLERTESRLLERLEAYAVIAIPEATETKFWNALVYGASSHAMHTETTRTLFGLQRLVFIQKDVDASENALDEELLKRTAPTPKETESAPPAIEPIPGELTELQKQILHNFIGEDVSGRSSDKW